ncbi:MAG: NADH:ubiquinone reductase (Na(+)-transporting) subunit C [Crocinitomix sp.]|nr:NADH:ubiquinone reductase (Na(+)-transporting) subunit C [Crocinitomix sp.]
MAIDKDKNGYTFLFSILMVIVVGSGLAAASYGLKPLQDKNLRVKKKMDILGALKIEGVDRKTAEDLYAQYIIEDECIVLDADGNIRDGIVAFDVDIKTQFRNKKLDPADRDFPLYVASIDGSTKYVIPVVGSGLWGPIWGYVAVDEDKSSIYGATFDHKTETPGLGAEIKQPFFYNQYLKEVISVDGEYKKIKVVKDGSGADDFKVDGITGGTITSKGVEEMVDRTIQVYVKYFNK